MEPKSPRSPISMASHSPCKELLDERVYRSVNDVHPGMKIDRDAVDHIRELVERVLYEILIVKPNTVAEVEKQCHSLFAPQQAQWIGKEAGETIAKWTGSRSHRGFNARTLQLQARLVAMIKEYLGFKEREKKDREKELERMALYLLTVVDFIMEDVIKWTGHYVKKLREADGTISLQNVKISLSADASLMQLNELLTKGDDDVVNSSGTVFDFDFAEPLSPRGQAVPGTSREQNYQEVSSQLLSDERQYLRDLNLLVNVFRRKFDAALTGDDKSFLEDVFGNVTELHELTMKMERTLEDAKEMSDQHCVGTGIWELAEAHEFDVYLQYIHHLSQSSYTAAIGKVLAEPKYAKAFELEARSFVGGASSSSSSLTGLSSMCCSFSLAVKYVLPSLLLAPLVHFFKYVEFCTRLHSFSESEEDRVDLSNTRSYLSSVASRIEKTCAASPAMQKRLKMEQSSRADSSATSTSASGRILDVEKRIDGHVGEPIARTCRELVKEGDLTMVRPSISHLTLDMMRRRWSTERHVFVFDHLLILCKNHKNSCKFKDRLAIRTIEVHDLEDTEVIQHSFRVEGRERQGQKGAENWRSYSYTFICKTAEEKEQWMEAVVSIQSRSLLDRMLDGYLKEERKRIPLVTPGVDQYIFAEQDNDDNIVFEDYTSSSGIPVVKNGTLVKLVERLTYHLYTDNAYVRTFLISYRSFCTPTKLLQLLIQRFEVPVPKTLQQQTSDMRGGPLAGRYDTVQSHGLTSSSGFFNSVFQEQSFQRFRKEYEAPIQLKVLNVMRKWVAEHWYDFEADYELLDLLTNFLTQLSDASRVSNQHRKFSRNIMSVISKKRRLQGSTPASEGHFNFAFDQDGEEETLAERERRRREINSFQPKKPEPVWHSAKKGNLTEYDLLSLHPLEIGRQLTLIHFDLYRAIKPIELVGAAWMRADKYKRSPQLLKLTDHSTQLTYWVSRSIVETESLEERVAMFARVLEVMSVFEELHNFTGLVAFYSALNKACVHRLTWCWDKLDNEKQKCYDRFKKLCNPHWTEMVKRLQSINPPCVPFFGHYLTSIVFFEGGNSTFVNMPGNDMKHDQLGDDAPGSSSQKRLLVSFLKCRRIASVISDIQMYQNEPYALQVEPSIRQFFESINPRNDFGDDGEALETYLYEKSLKIQPKDTEKPPNPDLKPKHVPSTLRSPGIKPPRTSASGNNQQNGSTERVLPFASSFGSSAFALAAHHAQQHSNTYTRRGTGGSEAKTAPPTPSYDSGDGRSPDAMARSIPRQERHTNEEAPSHFQLADIAGGAVRAAREHAKAMAAMGSANAATQSLAAATRAPPPPLNGVVGTAGPSTTSTLAPPPLLPRKATTKPHPSTLRSPPSAPPIPSSSSTSVPPPLHPRRATTTTSSAFNTLSPPNSRASTITSADGGSAFVFPTPSTSPPPSLPPPTSTPPAIPPRRPTTTHATQAVSEHHQTPNSSGGSPSNTSPGPLKVTLERPSLSPESAVSPTVSLSMPIPPALPPRRPRDALPPPLPPKASQPSPPNPSTPHQTIAPPLPPKTYKRRMHSSSPTNLA